MGSVCSNQLDIPKVSTEFAVLAILAGLMDHAIEIPMTLSYSVPRASLSNQQPQIPTQQCTDIPLAPPWLFSE